MHKMKFYKLATKGQVIISIIPNAVAVPSYFNKSRSADRVQTLTGCHVWYIADYQIAE